MKTQTHTHTVEKKRVVHLCTMAVHNSVTLPYGPTFNIENRSIDMKCTTFIRNIKFSNRKE